MLQLAPLGFAELIRLVAFRRDRPHPQLRRRWSPACQRRPKRTVESGWAVNAARNDRRLALSAAEPGPRVEGAEQGVELVRGEEGEIAGGHQLAENRDVDHQQDAAVQRQAAEDRPDAGGANQSRNARVNSMSSPPWVSALIASGYCVSGPRWNRPTSVLFSTKCSAVPLNQVVPLHLEHGGVEVDQAEVDLDQALRHGTIRGSATVPRRRAAQRASSE